MSKLTHLKEANNQHLVLLSNYLTSLFPKIKHLEALLPQKRMMTRGKQSQSF